MNSTHSRICRKDRFWLDFLGKIWYIEDMENTVKMIVAKNLIELRKRKNFTQGELAEMLNYSDKTISKWENGDSLPDISVLASLAEIYGITLDDLIHENAAEKVADKAEEKKALERYNQWIILSLSVVVVFLIATLIFVEGEYRLLAGVRVGGSRLLSCASLEKPQVGKRNKNE